MSKIRLLDDALEQLIRPGQAVHLTTQARAATRAIQRVFQGRDLGLKLIMGRVGGGHGADLLASGLIRHVIAGSYGAVSAQYTGRLAQVQRTYSSGKVTFEHWSFLSLMQRLAAAAQGMPFALSHSLAGSSMARSNPDAFMQIADPFGSGRRVNLLKALHPDVSILHVDAADEEGNAILLPPFEEGAWGAKASRHGVLVTAEHIVSADFIRAHSHLVQLPGRYVAAVAHVPYGAHPGQFGSGILASVRAYEEDEAFNSEYFAATRDPQALERWVDDWIYGLTDHAAYLRKLGDQRLADLGRNVNPTAKPPADVKVMSEDADSKLASGCNDNEIIMTLAMRTILRQQAKKGYDVYLVGAGLSEVPATAAYATLAKEGVKLDLTMGHGYYGFQPGGGRSNPDASTSLLTTDAITIYSTLLGGRIGSSLAILGAGQVDHTGNLNSTLIDGQLLTGSGGSNDAAATCDTVVVTRLSRKKLVEKVDYITCPGTSVSAIITEYGIFEKNAEGEMVLTRYIDIGNVGEGAMREKIAAGCGWPLKTIARLEREGAPSPDEIALIRSLMPSRYE